MPTTLLRQQLRRGDLPEDRSGARPRPVEIGAGVGLRQALQLEHIGPEDLRTVMEPDWLADGFGLDAEVERLEELRTALAKARSAYASIESEVTADRKKRVHLTAEEAKHRPRLNATEMHEKRGESVAWAERAFLEAADEVLGEIRARADEWIAQRAEAAHQATIEAEEAERVAAQLRAKANGVQAQIRWVSGQKRVVQDGRTPQVGILRWTIAQMPRPEDPPVLWAGS